MLINDYGILETYFYWQAVEEVEDQQLLKYVLLAKTYHNLSKNLWENCVRWYLYLLQAKVQ